MKKSVTILGAGIVGICCALSLTQRGVSVRLIDRGEPGQETSFGNAGVISPWSFIPLSLPGIWKNIPGLLMGPDRPLRVHPGFWHKMLPWGMRFLKQANEASVRSSADALQSLCQPSVDLFRQHLQGTGHEYLLTDSYYVHAFRGSNQPSLSTIDYRIRQEKDADLELITSDELMALVPALSSEFHSAVLIKGQARALSPGKLATVLAEKAQAQGVEIVRCEISSLRRSSTGWELLGAGQSLQADRVVLAAGAWSAGFLDELGLSLPLVAERGYHAEFAHPGISLPHSIMDVSAKLVASSMEGGLRVAGASEFAFPDTPADQRREALLVRQAKNMFPDLSVDEPSFWMGRRPSLPDYLPVLGGIDQLPGLYAAFGHSHFGLMTAPKTGEVMADLLTGEESDIDLSVFSYRRFGG